MAEIEGLRELSADLGRIASRALPEVDARAKRGAQNLKDDLVADAERSRHFRSVAPSISYDRSASVGQVSYEVGPDKDRAGGALGNLGYFGGANGGGGTLDLDGPVDREMERFTKSLDDYFGGL